MFKRKVKNPLWFSKKVEVKRSTVDLEGLGVFATELIEKREIFESAPVILFHTDFLKNYVEDTGGKHDAGRVIFRERAADRGQR